MISSLLGRGQEAKPAGETGVAIGDTDAHVFGCPTCGRPLNDGTWRCPTCGTRLVLGVALKRAGLILALGMVIGVLAGGAATAVAVSMSISGPGSTAGSLPIRADTIVPTDLPATAPPVVVRSAPDGPPSAAMAALRATAVVNARIATDMATLRSTLDDGHPSPVAIARALRSLSADAASGIDLVGRLAPWTAAAEVRSGLDSFYRDMADTARLGLRSSLADTAGYREAGEAMIQALSGLAAVDAASRSLATDVDLELPPVAIPAED
jgi:hypothetical protein